MILKKIPILTDNYVWILYNIHGSCVIIDPGLSDPVIKEIKKNKLNPIAILLTHNHIDHVGGVKEILYNYPKITVFGPNETKNYGVNKIISSENKITILDTIFDVFFTPGHTLGHVTYYKKPYLFCGDTLFSGGCGRVYKERYLEMYHSIKFIGSFPDDTMICCSHEYTLTNLEFSISILPNNQLIRLYFNKIKKLINLGKSTLPCFLYFERIINLFLRTDDCFLKKTIGLKCKNTDFEAFVQLRLKKDSFIGAKRD